MKTAFDPLAPTYDDVFTNTQIGRYLRGEVHQRLLHHFEADDNVLEMGCGTGQDALFLAEQGVNITATDASMGMIDIAREKIGNHPHITLSQLDLRKLNQQTAINGSAQFTGAFANFGVLNCLDDWQSLAKWLAERIQIGGIVGFGVMAPYCIWEVLWHGLHGNFSTATRRLRKTSMFQPESTAETMIESINIVYPTIRRLTQDFSPFFERVYVRPIGLVLPPSDVFGVIEKRPRLLKRLLQTEATVGKWRKLALFADHYWIEFRRVDTF